MARVVLERAGSAVAVDSNVCVKTGRRTDHRVAVRGQTTPSWISVLLLFTVIGYLLASSMTSRTYRVTVPFSEDVWRRWSANRRYSWALGLVGFSLMIAVLVFQPRTGGPGLGVGLAFVGGAIVIGTLNALRNNIGIRAGRHGELVLTRVSPVFVEAVRRGEARSAVQEAWIYVR